MRTMPLRTMLELEMIRYIPVFEQNHHLHQRLNYIFREGILYVRLTVLTELGRGRFPRLSQEAYLERFDLREHYLVLMRRPGDDDAQLWPPSRLFHQNLNAFVPLSKAAANPIIVQDLKSKLRRLGQPPEDDLISYASDTDINSRAGGMYGCSFDMIRKAHPEARRRLHHYLDPERPLGYFDDYYLIKFGWCEVFVHRTVSHQGPPPPDGYTDITAPANMNMAWFYHDDDHDQQGNAEQLIKIKMVERGFRVNFVTIATLDGRLHGEILAIAPKELYSVLLGYRVVANEMRRREAIAAARDVAP